MATEYHPNAYAQAIFEQSTEDWLKPLKLFSERVKPSDMEDLDRPDVSFEQKQATIQRLLPPNSSLGVRNFLFLLASKNDMHLLPGIVSEFDRYSQRAAARAAARVTSAVPLTDAEKGQLEQKIRARFGQESEFEYIVDPEILGGVIVRLGDKVIDGSVSGKLAALREKLK